MSFLNQSLLQGSSPSQHGIILISPIGHSINSVQLFGVREVGESVWFRSVITSGELLGGAEVEGGAAVGRADVLVGLNDGWEVGGAGIVILAYAPYCAPVVLSAFT